MTSLGSLGKRKDKQVVGDISFDWFDTDIHLASKRFSELEFIDLMEAADQIDETDIRAITFVKDLFRRLLVDETVEGETRLGLGTFWRLAIENDQNVEDLMAVYQVLLGAQTNRPTLRPADSSDGPQRTPESSPVVSSSAPASTGRPDLQLARDGAAADRAKILAAVGA